MECRPLKKASVPLRTLLGMDRVSEARGSPGRPSIASVRIKKEQRARQRFLF